MQKQTILLALTLLITYPLLSQSQAKITVEDIWRDYKFMGKSVPGFNFLNDGKHYTRLVDDSAIHQYDLVSGKKVETLMDAANIEDEQFPEEFDSYTFSADESLSLIHI